MQDIDNVRIPKYVHDDPDRRGCRRRSVPARSGAPQLPPPTGHETLLCCGGFSIVLVNSKINDHGPRGHKAGGAAQPALSSWLAFSPAAVTACKTNLKIKFRFSKDGLEDHDEHDCTSTIRHNSFRVHVKIRNCGDAHDGTMGRRICAL